MSACSPVLLKTVLPQPSTPHTVTQDRKKYWRLKSRSRTSNAVIRMKQNSYFQICTYDRLIIIKLFAVGTKHFNISWVHLSAQPVHTSTAFLWGPHGSKGWTKMSGNNHASVKFCLELPYYGTVSHNSTWTIIFLKHVPVPHTFKYWFALLLETRVTRSYKQVLSLYLIKVACWCMFRYENFWSMNHRKIWSQLLKPTQILFICGMPFYINTMKRPKNQPD